MQNMTDQLTSGSVVWFYIPGRVYAGRITDRATDWTYSVVDLCPDDYNSMDGLRLSDLYTSEAEARAAMQKELETTKHAPARMCPGGCALKLPSTRCRPTRKRPRW
jgi:hypothetical protein